MNFTSAFKVARKFAAVVVTSAVCFSSAHASIVYTLDTKLGSSNLPNSSDANELAAMKAFAHDSSLVLLSKVSDEAVHALANPGAAGEFYIDIGSQKPLFFLLKFGIGSTDSKDDTFFFKNIGELSTLVFANSDVNFLSGGDCGAKKDSACNIGRLSHYDIFGASTGGGTGTAVPEPATVALIGLGLLGFAASRRKAKAVKAA